MRLKLVLVLDPEYRNASNDAILLLATTLKGVRLLIRYYFICVVVLLIVFAGACNQSETNPGPTATTPAVAPTNTPMAPPPTTPIPIPTQLSTATPKTTPTQLSPAAPPPTATPTLAPIATPTPTLVPIPTPTRTLITRTPGSDLQMITIDAPEGRMIEAMVAWPEGSGPFPVVVVLHGTSGHSEEYVQLAQDLAKNGFIAVAGCWFEGSHREGRSAPRDFIGCPNGPRFTGISIEGGRVCRR